MTTIIGASPVATRNRVLLKSGVTSFVCCGADIILSGLFQDVEGEARCPICNRTVHLVIKNRKIDFLKPSSALLHYVRYDVREDPRVFGIVCESTFLFDRKECLDAWSKTNTGPSGEVAKPSDFLAEASRRSNAQTQRTEI